MTCFRIVIVELERLLERIKNAVIVKEVCVLMGGKPELENLRGTVVIIKDILLQADDADHELSVDVRRFVSDLKAAAYDADDLFDECFTLAKLNEIDGNKGGKFSFNENKSSQAKQMSRRVKEIRKQLDTIADDYNKFGRLISNYTPIVRRQKETYTYVDAVKNIIGRDTDKKDILDVLLDPCANDDFCFLSIVGPGGLGKTTIAQMLYSDESIRNEFLLLWVCVSDHDGRQFDVKTILCEILGSLNYRQQLDNNSSSLATVQQKFQEQISGKKYFLVIDDLWNEDYAKWKELEKFLRMGLVGSRIVVTTRSEKTASCIGSKHVHKLKGLSEEDSWSLFEMTAFREEEKDLKLVEIGENIVKKFCCNNPFAIKVLGSHLRCQNKREWEYFYEQSFNEGSEKFIFTLEASFNNLTPSLKNCFSYCSIFPKDFEMDKDMLISLWLSQGYIVPLVSGQTIEDAAEESFLILLQRYFFKDVKKDKWGNITSVKLHDDFMHEIAQKVSGEETCVVSSRLTNLKEKTCHEYVENEYEESVTCNTRIRLYFSRDLTDQQVEDMRALRALTLCSPSLRLPSSLDKLMLLRYIKLESVNLLSLPDSITRLYNLQTLILNCIRLRELPKYIANLINLRHLDISHCASLIGIPLSMEKLTNLAVLLPCNFVVGYGDSNAELKILQAFTRIKGELHIKIRENYRYEYGASETEGTYLKDVMKYLSHLNLEFKDSCIDQEDVLKKIQLPPNLKGLTLQWYKGTTIPWSSQASFVLPHHLVRIEIIQCHKLKQLPVLSKLPNLKSLFLYMLNSVEYLEEVISNISSSDTKEVAEFFPSLESLEIRWMSKLKGWWKGNERLNAFPRLSFLSMAVCPEFSSFLSELQLPCLRELHIERCGKFASNLVCPRLEKLNLDKINENLLITCENSQVDVVIKNRVNDLKSVRTFCLTALTISNCIDWEVMNFSEFKKEFEKSCCSSLLTLAIENCEFIRRLSGLEHLTVLQVLTLDYNQQLIINEDDEEPWKSFGSLRRLKLSSLRRMKSLPKGMQHLNFLEHLVLHDCKNLEGLPEWMSRLSSLKSMEIYECPGIKSFPEAIKDLFSLDNLSIYGCPDLEKSCREDSEKIEDITNVSYAKPSREEFFLRR